MPCKATQDKRVIEERSDKMWSSGGGNDKPLQYSCCANYPMNITKKQKYITPKDESPRLEGVQLGKSGRQLLIAAKRMKLLGQSGNNAQLWMCTEAEASILWPFDAKSQLIGKDLHAGKD